MEEEKPALLFKLFPSCGDCKTRRTSTSLTPSSVIVLKAAALLIQNIHEGEGRKHCTTYFHCTVLWGTGAVCCIWPWCMTSQELPCLRTLLEWSVGYSPEQLSGMKIKQLCTRPLRRLGNFRITEWPCIFLPVTATHIKAGSRTKHRPVTPVFKAWVTTQWHIH